MLHGTPLHGTPHLAWCPLFVALGVAACSDGETAETNGIGPDAAIPADVAATDSRPSDAVPVGRSNPDAATNPDAACSAQITIGLYGDGECTRGEERMLIVMNLAQDCYGWTRSSDRGEVHNSATRIQCYRDRICYTQHTTTLACDGANRTDKETRTDRCTPEPQGGLWTRIIGGTEACPEPPPGFACPVSEPLGGTSGIAPASACTKS
jgi:hypothetical protein